MLIHLLAVKSNSDISRNCPIIVRLASGMFGGLDSCEIRDFHNIIFPLHRVDVKENLYVLMLRMGNI